MTRPSTLSTSSQAIGLLVWLSVAFAAAAVGGFASASASEFYRDLVRPSWAPHGWLFAPVWSVLYALMGVAAWLVWRAGNFDRARNALLAFVVQLSANALWTWLFFAWRQGGMAFAEGLVLLALIVTTIVLFWRINRLAAVLLFPYLLWVSFASALTLSTWRLNPGLLG